MTHIKYIYSYLKDDAHKIDSYLKDDAHKIDSYLRDDAHKIDSYLRHDTLKIKIILLVRPPRSTPFIFFRKLFPFIGPLKFFFVLSLVIPYARIGSR